MLPFTINIAQYQKGRHNVYFFSAYYFFVRLVGLEPTRPFGHQSLKLACLPFQHSRIVPDYPGGHHTAFLILMRRDTGGTCSNIYGKLFF